MARIENWCLTWPRAGFVALEGVCSGDLLRALTDLTHFVNQ